MVGLLALPAPAQSAGPLTTCGQTPAGDVFFTGDLDCADFFDGVREYGKASVNDSTLIGKEAFGAIGMFSLRVAGSEVTGSGSGFPGQSHSLCALD